MKKERKKSDNDELKLERGQLDIESDFDENRIKLERGQIGIAGEHLVLAELIVNGFAAGRTDGNSRDIDILCSDINSGRTTNVQVKTLGPDTDYSTKNRQCFRFHLVDIDKHEGALEEVVNTILDKRIYFVFCAIANPDYPEREKTRYFVATPEEVVTRIKARANKGRKRIDFILYDQPYEMKKSKEEYGIVSDYEERWGKLGKRMSMPTTQENIAEKFEACNTLAKVSYRDRREEIALRLLQEIDLNDVLFVRCWCDATWDHESEDYGDFFDMVYAKDGVLVQVRGNIKRENKEISGNFWRKVSAAMINVKPEKSWVGVYFNKAVAKDMEWDPENYVLRYKWRQFKFYEPEYSA